jgi:hypothetical protein
MDTTDKPTGTPRAGLTVLSSEAPFIYFDGATTYGVNFGAIQIELAANIIVPTEDGGTKTEIVMTAHLRCSPKAAAGLRDSIDRVLAMVEQAANAAAMGKPEGKLN